MIWKNKYFNLIFYCIAFANISFSQNGFPKYYEFIGLNKKADSLYKAKDFKTAALFYSAAAGVLVEKAIPIDYSAIHYNAACSWALANEKDSAFNNLELIAEAMIYADYEHLIEDSDLTSLHKNKRWENILEAVKSNAERKESREKNYEERTCYKGTGKEIIFYPHTELARQFIDNDSLPFISVDYENFRIYFRGNSYAAMNLPEIKQKLSSAFQRILVVLDTTNYYRGINLVLLDSPEEMKELTGFEIHGGLALAEHDLVFCICNDKRKMALKHEIFHFISLDIWGNSTSRLLLEGSAVYTENQCFDYENAIYSLNAYILKEKKQYPFQTLINDFDNKSRESEVITFLESAAIFKYLFENFGAGKMKQLWKSGFKSFESIYGISLLKFEQEWISFISKFKPPENLEWQKLLEKGCG